MVSCSHLQALRYILHTGVSVPYYHQCTKIRILNTPGHIYASPLQQSDSDRLSNGSYNHIERLDGSRRSQRRRHMAAILGQETALLHPVAVDGR